MRHLAEITSYVPDLKQRHILDIGSGRGSFLISAHASGYTVTGVEPHEAYRDIIKQTAKGRNLIVNIHDGTAEHLPFPDEHFSFANVNEVFEHVHDPAVLLQELYRVLSPGSFAYVSVPNRFGLFDPHYHLVGINWMPRICADWLLRTFGRLKNDGKAGNQKLSTMHYQTFASALRMFRSAGFSVNDIRELKIKRRVPRILHIPILALYQLVRFVYFDTFHFLLEKNKYDN